MLNELARCYLEWIASGCTNHLIEGQDRVDPVCGRSHQPQLAAVAEDLSGLKLVVLANKSLTRRQPSMSEGVL